MLNVWKSTSSKYFKQCQEAVFYFRQQDIIWSVLYLRIETSHSVGRNYLNLFEMSHLSAWCCLGLAWLRFTTQEGVTHKQHPLLAVFARAEVLRMGPVLNHLLLLSIIMLLLKCICLKLTPTVYFFYCETVSSDLLIMNIHFLAKI